MRNRSTAVVASAAILAVLVLLGACSPEPETVDLDGLEDDVRATLDGAYAADGLTLFDVACPRSAARATPGDVFACTADVERRFVRIQVEALPSGAWEFTTLDLVLDLDAVEALVAAEMSAQLADTIDLDCGSPRLRVLPLGAALACEAVDSGRNAVRALLTVRGRDQLDWELLR